MKKFAPPLYATLCSLLVLAALLGLGCWQVKRLEWKTALLADIHDRMEKPSAPLPEKLEDPASWEFRRVTLAGSYVGGHDFILKPRVRDSVPGGEVYTPFRRASGGTVIVDRGWVPDNQKDFPAPGGTIEIEGIVRLAHKNSFTPDNVPEKDEWYWPDPEAMGRAAQLERVSPVTVTLSGSAPGEYPAAGKVLLDIPNNHMQYAIFWFLMAGISQVIFFLRFRSGA